VIEDLLDYVWVSDVGDDAHGAATQWAHGNINIKDSFESLSPGQGGNKLIPTSSFFCHFVSFAIPFVLQFLNRPNTLFWDNEFSNLRIGSEYAMIPNKIMSGSRYQRSEFA